MIVVAVISGPPASGIKSLRTISASPKSTGWRFKDAKAVTRISAPSSSRIFDEILLPIYSKTSSGAFNLSCAAFLRRIAIRVSNSGGWMSVIRPHSKRLRKRSSKVVNCFGGRSLEITICLFALYKVLNVWKNSSWVRSLFSKN